MSLWFKFGHLHHLQVEAEPQRAGCGTKPLKPQATFEAGSPPQFACRRCMVAWLDEDVLMDESVEDAKSRGYTAAD